MSPHRQQAIALVFLISVMLAPPSLAQGETDFGQVSMHVANMLQNHHYSRLNFDDELSQNLLRQYLDSLDYTKRFFTQEDVDQFTAKYGNTLDDEIQMQNVQPALEMYAVYDQRVRQRIALAMKLIKESTFTFDANESIEITRKDSGWPRNETEVEDLWRRIIKNQFLEEELQRSGLASDEEDSTVFPDPDSSLNDDSRPRTGSGKDKAEPEKPLTEEERLAGIREDLLERWDRVLKSLQDTDDEEKVNYFLTALAMTYDPHSDYFSHQELDNFQIQMRHSLTGIGAMLSMVEGMAEIQGLVVGGPAHKSKRLDVEDRITGVAQGIEGEMIDIIDMKLANVVELIRGAKGSIVRLNVIPAGGDATQIKEVAIVRDTVELKDKLANAELILTKSAAGEELRLGWIYLYSFYADMNGGATSTTADVRRLLERLIRENIDGLVLDLRGNGGGSLEEAINLTGLFIARGPVVQSKDWRGQVEFRRSRNKSPVYDGPLVVLTSKASASASEILAAALQDFNRALLVGEKSTFGKGTVQTIMPVSKQMPIFSEKDRAGAIKVTIQKFYRIAGGSTQLRGVIPDIVLPSRADVFEIGEESLDNPLPYDVIDPQPFDLFSTEPLPVAELTQRSATRMSNDREFQYVVEDSARIKERIDKNVASLNKEERLREAEEIRERNKLRDDERRERFAKVREVEKDLFTIYKLTLDNVDETTLTLRDKFSDEESSGMILGEAGSDGRDDSLVYPHRFDPVMRETLEVLQDFVEIGRGNAAATAKVSDTTTPPQTPQ